MNSETYDLAMGRLLEAKHGFGSARLRLGAILCAIQDAGEWEGRAHGGFYAFMRENGVDPHSGSLFMKVARKFVIELQPTADQMDRLCLTPISVLAAAVPVATKVNLDELLFQAQTLSKDDALNMFAEMQGLGRRIKGTDPQTGLSSAETQGYPGLQ